MLGDGPQVIFHDPPPPPPTLGQLAPTSYVKYEPGDPNHDRYVRKISLNPPFGEALEPHYVCFDLDFGNHQHYVIGLRDDSTPPLEPYGWSLEAAPFIGPRLPTPLSDNEALGIFDAGYPGAVEVDIALYELRDYGVTADVDRYRGHMLEYEVLLEEKRLLDKKLRDWRSKSLGPRVCLIKAHARNRLHPYLHQGEPITRPSAYRTQGPFCIPSPDVHHVLVSFSRCPGWRARVSATLV
jgi:hypothetical protein